MLPHGAVRGIGIDPTQVSRAVWVIQRPPFRALNKIVIVVPEQAWDLPIQDLCDRVHEGLRFYTRQDLLPFHHLHVIGDPDLYGATSHQVRGHFLSLVPEHLKARVRPGATNLQNDQDWTYAKFHAQI
ncbi:hypothetical protein E4U43_007827 [Claviceps pusilla]|uniref:Uncharacterized protein n=1 Tax=Claviceps pusilla TaxID=123648 RepID=A0A9P7NBZ6_9HYPO|nr:hypothetical protein E4U43_007827 [Claviceps pusilla]